MKASYRDPREYLSSSPTTSSLSSLRERSRMDELQRRIDELEATNAQLKSTCKALESENAQKQAESQRKIRLCEASWTQIHSDNIQQKKFINQQKEIIANQSDTIREQRMQMKSILDDESQHREVIASQIKTTEARDEDIKFLKLQLDTLSDEVDSLELKDFTNQETIISLNAQLSNEAKFHGETRNSKIIKEQKEIIAKQSETIREQRIRMGAMLDDEAQHREIIVNQIKKIEARDEDLNHLKFQVDVLSDEVDSLELRDFMHQETIISLNAQLDDKSDRSKREPVLDDKTQQTEIIKEQKEKIKSQNEDIQQLKSQVESLSVELMDYKSQNKVIVSLKAQLEEKGRLIAIEKEKSGKYLEDLLSNVDNFSKKTKPKTEEKNIDFMSYQQEPGHSDVELKLKEHEKVTEQLQNAENDQLQTKLDIKTKAENDQLQTKLDIKTKVDERLAMRKTEIESPTRIQILEDAVAEAIERLAAAAAAEKAFTTRMRILENTITDAGERLTTAEVTEKNSAIRIKMLEDALAHANERLATEAAAGKASTTRTRILENTITDARERLTAAEETAFASRIKILLQDSMSDANERLAAAAEREKASAACINILEDAIARLLAQEQCTSRKKMT